MQKYLFLLAFLIVLMISASTNAQDGYDSVSFEFPTSKIIIDAETNHVWQIGNPGKDFFGTAYAGQKAILTDTIYYYPTNDTSSFIYVIRDPYTHSCNTSMEFWHKYDMDTLTDIGIIDASYDGGKSWIIVNDTSVALPSGSYFSWEYDYHASSDIYTPHTLLTTGKSDGWILSRFSWQWWLPVKADTIIANPDSLMIRFTFISDSIEGNREGWMIDEIVIYSIDPQLCTDISENITNKKLSVFPNPFSQKATLNTKFVLKNSTILVYNAFGQVVERVENLSGQQLTLYRNNLPSGLYHLLLLENNKVLATEKIIITD